MLNTKLMVSELKQIEIARILFHWITAQVRFQIDTRFWLARIPIGWTVMINFLKPISVLMENAQMVKLTIMRKNPSSGGFIKSEIKKRHMHLSSMNFVKIVLSIAALSMAMSKEGIYGRPESSTTWSWTRTKFCGPLKGNGYHPSYEFNVSLSAERLTSSWNLVEIDGEWKIIDTQVRI